jgi:hypothetical protein
VNRRREWIRRSRVIACRRRTITALSSRVPPKKPLPRLGSTDGYDAVLADVVRLVDAARRGAVRSVNTIMTATYWSRIVEQEQRGEARAGYGEVLIVRLSRDLQARFGRGFGRANLFQMRAFYLAYRHILQIPSGESAASGKVQTPSGFFAGRDGDGAATRFRLPWSHYVRLLAVRNPEARTF